MTLQASLMASHDRAECMQHFVYILECSDRTYYVGSTSDPAGRLDSHQLGCGAVYTSSRLPVRLVYQECHATLGAAVDRERQIKRWSRAKKAALISHDLDTLHSVARRRRFRTERPG